MVNCSVALPLSVDVLVAGPPDTEVAVMPSILTLVAEKLAPAPKPVRLATTVVPAGPPEGFNEAMDGVTVKLVDAVVPPYVTETLCPPAARGGTVKVPVIFP
jgi:hypothetical protein